jgi:hypothetical protein
MTCGGTPARRSVCGTGASGSALCWNRHYDSLAGERYIMGEVPGRPTAPGPPTLS